MRRLPVACGPCAAVLCCVLLAALPACGGGGAAAPAEVTGRIVEIVGEGSAVERFTVEGADESYELRIAADVDYGFDLAHLHEHERTGEPVRCDVEERNGVLYALSIDDV